VFTEVGGFLVGNLNRLYFPAALRSGARKIVHPVLFALELHNAGIHCEEIRFVYVISILKGFIDL